MIANFMLSGLIVFLTLTAPSLGHKKETGNEGGTVDRRYNVLDFGKTIKDYVMMRPNMQPLQRAFSVCSWLKKRRSDGTRDTPTWFNYATSTHSNEILLSDNGYWTHIHNDHLDLSSKFTAALGSWFHECMTWSTARGKKSVYVNGELAGYESVSSSALELDGVVALGLNQASPGAPPHSSHETHMFGGELYKLNVYAKELTAAEVKEMAEEGFCSEVEEKYGLTRYLKWEDILLEERTGNVTEQDSGCHKPTPPGPTTASRWAILKSDTYYNKTLTHELVDQLRAAMNILEDFIGATVDDGFIRHFKFFHDENTDAGDD